MSKPTLESSISKINSIFSANKKFNIFTSVRSPEHIKAKVTKIHQLGDSRPLAGTICAIKDNIVTSQEPTTCASKILYDYKSPFESTVTDLLIRNGSVLIGKTNLDEFGMGDSNSFSHYGQTYNPHYGQAEEAAELLDENKYIPGGSSGGSAAAVAANVCDFALGTDTGGSVRLPAAYCGVIGFKPSYARISRWGVVPYAQSLDTVGILSRNIGTIQKVFNVVNKYDQKDPTSLSEDLRSLISSHIDKRGLNDNLNSPHKVTIGISKEYLAKGISVQTLETINLLISKLYGKGYQVKPVNLSILPYCLPTYFTIAYAEAASNMSRYDGVRYGYSATEDERDSSDDYRSFIKDTRSVGFGNEVKKRVLVGNYNLSSLRFKNNFLKAEMLRKQLTEQFNRTFKMANILSQQESTALNSDGVDFIIAPVSNSPAPKLSDHLDKEKQNPLNSYLNDVFLAPASLAGLPSISIPCNPKSPGEAPIGVQIIGQYGDDERVLRFAQQAENLASN